MKHANAINDGNRPVYLTSGVLNMHAGHAASRMLFCIILLYGKDDGALCL
jgi:hypothetical protein